MTRLRVLADPDPGAGLVARLEERRALVPSKEEFTEAWRRAIASVASRNECPVYGGLELEPLDGLYPLGRDPGSGLWEFAGLRSGAPPERDADGRLVRSPESGLVLVLIPPGSFEMGSAGLDAEPRTGSDIGVFYPGKGKVGRPRHPVTLTAYLVSKWEVRRCEWLRVMGAIRQKSPFE